VLGLAAGDLGCDAALAELAAVAVVVVAAVGGDTLRPAARTTDTTAHRRHSLDERDQLGNVVAVAARERPRERDPGRVDQDVVLGAGPGSVNRARARLGAPFFACTWLESTTARDHSISPATRNRASKTSSAAPRHRPSATRPACANRSRRSRSQARPAGASTRSPCAARTDAQRWRREGRSRTERRRRPAAPGAQLPHAPRTVEMSTFGVAPLLS
jgi:hypothetical protein